LIAQADTRLHPTFSEAELIAGCRAADRKAQEHLFRTYYSDFLKVCLRYAADTQEANSMLSDAFFKIFTKASTYSGSGSFEGWMRQVVINTCLTAVRTRLSHRAVVMALPGENAELPEHPDRSAQNDAVSNMGYQELTRLIQGLPTVSRTVFNLYVFEGYSHREIAAQLGISEGTSHWHLSTARQWLKSKLQATRHG
jgi:RNA polymerase sigma factor (sigma-70 family)